MLKRNGGVEGVDTLGRILANRRCCPAAVSRGSKPGVWAKESTWRAPVTRSTSPQKPALGSELCLCPC